MTHQIKTVGIAGTGLVNLPKPVLVASGGGLHAYWPLTSPVDVAVWKPVAERLKRLCEERAFAIDFGVTADVARVLRVPGTTNWKDPNNPRLCRILAAGGGTVSLDAFASAIGYEAFAEEPAPALLVIPGTRPKAADTAAGVKLLQNSTVHFKDLLRQVSDGKGCGQLLHYVEHAQEDAAAHAVHGGVHGRDVPRPGSQQ